MKVRVQLFAAVRQAAGRDWIELDLPAGATIGHLRRWLAQEIPRAAGVVEQALFAVNTEYAGDTAVVPAEAEVACIPPVGGG
jgi:molybdopterin converting factor subunit 1